MKKLLILFAFIPVVASAQDTITDKTGKSHTVKILNETADNLTVRLESGSEVTYAKSTLKSHAYAEKLLPINKETGKIEFQSVVEVPGKSKDEIYTATREWFAKTFVSANAVLQMEDKENGKLIGRGHGKHVVKSSPNAIAGYVYDFSFLVTVDIKDGRYRYTLSDIMFLPSSLYTYKQPAESLVLSEKAFRSNGTMRPYNQSAKTAILEYMPIINTSLEEFVSTSKTSENW